MEYHKIQTMFKRDEKTKKILDGEWTTPEFEYLADNNWVFTEKVDGTNIRIEYGASGITFGCRTEAAQIPAQLVAVLERRFLTASKRVMMREIFGDASATLYGEGYGNKIQKLGVNYRLDQDFVLFDVRIGHWWLKREDVCDIAGKLDLDVVPIIGTGTLDQAIKMVQKGIFSTWGAFEAEGIVARPEVELKARDGSRIITKIKARDFK